MFEANIILNFLIMKKKKLNVKLNLGKHKISNLTSTKIIGGWGHSAECSGVIGTQCCGTESALGNCGSPTVSRDDGSECKCL
jgi:hypothetical protein